MSTFNRQLPITQSKEIEDLKDKDPNVRLRAVRMLKETKDVRGTDALVNALKDEEIYIRWNAAEALGIIGDERAIDPLIAALKDQYKAVQEEAAKALSRFAAQRAKEAVLNYQKGTHPRSAKGETIMDSVKCSNCAGLGKTVKGVNFYSLDPETQAFYRDKLTNCTICGGSGLVSIERSYYSHDPNVAINMLGQKDTKIARIEIPSRSEEVFVTFEDGSKYMIGGFTVGYSGSRPSNFKIFLDRAGFDISYEEIVAMKPPVILEPPNRVIRIAGANADTIEEASKLARGQLKKYEKIIDEKKTLPSQKFVQVKAFDEKTAKAHVEKKIGDISKIIGIKIKAPGKKGFWGIGKQPNTYEATIFIPAFVELEVAREQPSAPIPSAPPMQTFPIPVMPAKIEADNVPVQDCSDEKVPCRRCGKMIFKRMAALKDGYCLKCSGSAKSVFAPESQSGATFSKKAQTTPPSAKTSIQFDIPNPPRQDAIPNREMLNNSIIQLTNKLVAYGFRIDILDNRPYEDALEKIVRIGEPAIPSLLDRLGQSKYIAIALGKIGTSPAIRALGIELHSSDSRRVEAAAYGLGYSGDAMVKQILESAIGSQYDRQIAEVHTAIHWALNKLTSLPTEKGAIKIDRSNIWNQIQAIPTSREGLKEKGITQEQALQLCKDIMKELPNLSVKVPGYNYTPANAKARTWSILASTIYYLQNPDDRFFSKPCPEALFCFQQALNSEPSESYWRQMVDRFTALTPNEIRLTPAVPKSADNTSPQGPSEKEEEGEVPCRKCGRMILKRISDLILKEGCCLKCSGSLCVYEVTPNEDFSLTVVFDNGEKRLFNMKPLLDIGAFKKLRDYESFRRVRVAFETIEWDEVGVLDPEFIYQKSRATENA